MTIVDNLDLNAYLPIFIEESKEYIQQISDNLLHLEHDNADSAAVNEIFRAVHTIKGMSATMGYTQICNLAHGAENLLEEVRNNKVSINSDIVTGFFQIIDELGASVSHLENTGEPGYISDDKMAQILGAFSQSELMVSVPKDRSVVKQPPEQPNSSQEKDNTYLLEIYFSKDCLLPQARAMIVCNQLNSIGKLLRTSPAQDTLANLNNLEKIRCWVSDIEPGQVRDLLDGGVEIDYYTIEKAGAMETQPQTPDIEPVINDNELELTEPHQESHVMRHTIRVDTEKLDILLNLVSELVINKTALVQAAATHPILADGVEHLHRLTTELQNIVMKMRMVPLDTVFNRFPRMIRDTALSLDKLVNFEIHGGETELDRTIIEDMADPLMHLLRNAIDHGIESVEQRVHHGKPRVGTVTLRAYQTGSQVIVEVADDGRGLDLAQIRKKAWQQGFISDSEPESSELANLIFSPGFSTVDSVTDISGRGVGLDVVKNAIETLGGSIEVISGFGTGTTFRISLPLTLAIIQGLLVSCGDEVYAIPLSYVEETGIVFPDEIQIVGQQEIIMLRGKVLPIAFLQELLGIKKSNVSEELSLVVVRYGERQIGLIVDDLLNQQDIVIKNVSWGEHFFRNFLGCSLLGDGSVVMIIDINVLLSAVKVRGGNNA